MKLCRWEKDKPYVFVSYSSDDWETVKKIMETVNKALDLNVWMDERLFAGIDWDDTVKNVIESDYCRAVLFFGSSNSLMSNAVEKELDMAEKSGKRILPINLENKSFVEIYKQEIEPQKDHAIEKETAKRMVNKYFPNERIYINVNERLSEKLRQSLEDLLKEPVEYVKAGTPEKDSRTTVSKEEKVSATFQMETELTAKSSDITLEEIRMKFQNTEVAIKFRTVRESMSKGGKGAMDYLMASVLGGCNQITEKSPVYQINYYRYTVARPQEEKSGNSLGATWTWSSNCRKFLLTPQNGEAVKSGSLPKEINERFSKLPKTMTLTELKNCFRMEKEAAFQLSKGKEQLEEAFRKLEEFL